jgi:hypothetical protein
LRLKGEEKSQKSKVKSQKSKVSRWLRTFDAPAALECYRASRTAAQPLTRSLLTFDL